MAADEIIQPEHGLPTGTCPLCGGIIQDVLCGMHWDGPNGWGQLYSGLCTCCDIDFLMEVGTNPRPWQIDAPDADSLQSVVTEAELVALSGKLSEMHGAKWQSVLARRRTGDELWHFHDDVVKTGIAVVRNARPIAGFTVSWMEMCDLRVSITRYTSDYESGWAECRRLDAHGREWLFEDKFWIFSADGDMTIHTKFPKPGLIGCRIVKRWHDSKGREIVTVSTKLPDHVQSRDGQTDFDVLREQLAGES